MCVCFWVCVCVCVYVFRQAVFSIQIQVDRTWVQKKVQMPLLWFSLLMSVLSAGCIIQSTVIKVQLHTEPGKLQRIQLRMFNVSSTAIHAEIFCICCLENRTLVENSVDTTRFDKSIHFSFQISSHCSDHGVRLQVNFALWSSVSLQPLSGHVVPTVHLRQSVCLCGWTDGHTVSLLGVQSSQTSW